MAASSGPSSPGPSGSRRLPLPPTPPPPAHHVDPTCVSSLERRPAHYMGRTLLPSGSDWCFLYITWNTCFSLAGLGLLCLLYIAWGKFFTSTLPPVHQIGQVFHPCSASCTSHGASFSPVLWLASCASCCITWQTMLHPALVHNLRSPLPHGSKASLMSASQGPPQEHISLLLSIL